MRYLAPAWRIAGDLYGNDHLFQFSFLAVIILNRVLMSSSSFSYTTHHRCDSGVGGEGRTCSRIWRQSTRCLRDRGMYCVIAEVYRSVSILMYSLVAWWNCWRYWRDALYRGFSAVSVQSGQQKLLQCSREPCSRGEPRLQPFSFFLSAVNTCCDDSFKKNCWICSICVGQNELFKSEQVVLLSSVIFALLLACYFSCFDVNWPSPTD